jgi:hypothetical protein
LICDKIKGVLFVAEKNKARNGNEREREEGRSLGHKLNITDGITDEFKHVGNFVCKNDMPSYFLVFILFFSL